MNLRRLDQSGKDFMVIIGNKSGQLGNRLFVFAHIIANAIEYGYEVSNPSFHDYAQYFASLRHDFFCRYPSRTTSLKSHKILQAAYLVLLSKSVSISKKLGFRLFDCDFLKVNAMGHDGDDYHLSSSEFIGIRESSRHLMLNGWAFRDFPNMGKHAEEIRRFFAPADQHAANIERLMEKARKDCDLLVGVHIRQGDYRKWLGGRHFYDTRQYADIMRRFVAQSGGKRLKFLICSNAAQDIKLFDGLDYLIGNNHQFEDLYSFAKCDLLIGPPSTYTMWASYYGSVPLFVLQSATGPIPADGFQISKG
jgi:hypothetical protein